MTTWDRFLLFGLSSLCTVIIPAVMMNLHHTMQDVLPADEWLLNLIVLVPLIVVLAICFAGLFYSIFRVRPVPPRDRQSPKSS